MVTIQLQFTERRRDAGDGEVNEEEGHRDLNETKLLVELENVAAERDGHVVVPTREDLLETNRSMTEEKFLMVKIPRVGSRKTFNGPSVYVAIQGLPFHIERHEGHPDRSGDTASAQSSVIVLSREHEPSGHRGLQGRARDEDTMEHAGDSLTSLTVAGKARRTSWRIGLQ